MLDKEEIILGNGISVMAEILNARQVVLTYNEKLIGYGTLVNILIEGNNIEVIINKQKFHYSIYSIAKISQNSIRISTNYPTKTKHFLLPTLGFDKQTFQVDTFLEDVRLGKNLDRLYLIYRFIPGDVYNAMETFIKDHSNFVSLHDSDTEHVTYELTIPTEFLGIVIMFTKGKYSQFPLEYKKAIMKFYGFDNNGETHKILFRDESRRKQMELELKCDIPAHIDLWDSPDLTKEYYDGSI